MMDIIYAIVGLIFLAYLVALALFWLPGWIISKMDDGRNDPYDDDYWNKG